MDYEVRSCDLRPQWITWHNGHRVPRLNNSAVGWLNGPQKPPLNLL